MRMDNRVAAASLCLLLLAVPAATAEEEGTNHAEQRQFTYAWPFSKGDEMAPRGGTSRGADITLVEKAGEAWTALQEEGISGKERDRRAILAMAGPYRASFDFIETLGFSSDYSPARPYQSWGTEYVYVVADQPDFISLQHIMVMVFESPDGEQSPPVVIKHWRQDWRYEDTTLNVYIGDNTWERRELAPETVKGTWSQAVFQVDDSPRYESYGRWVHRGNYSSWESGTTWRPLPRREFSVRDDYDVLAGSNRHTITPTGWVQEEDNLKTLLASPGEPDIDSPYLAREAGLNRYQRIRDHDFQAGDTYWKRTGAFWAEVRSAWNALLREHTRVQLKKEVNGKKLFEWMFAYAGDIESRETYDPTAGRAFVADTLVRFTLTED